MSMIRLAAALAATLALASVADARCFTASRYGEGTLTASGERFHRRALTAAHRTLPFGTKLHITNPANGWSITVRINDRGPFIAGRDLDLSEGAADAIGLTEKIGIAKVCTQTGGTSHG